MKTRVLLCVALLLTAAPLAAQEQKAAAPAKAKAAHPSKPAMDPKAMEEMMMKMAAPGPHHEMFKKMEGEWKESVSWSMDPSQPTMQDSATAVVKTLMDGRYCQEESSGSMMGRPFSGMGITGYDNVLNKYVSTWIDNAGTGIMMSEGTPDATGNTINWTGQMSDPMTGKMSKVRMVSRMIDDNKHIFEMYLKDPAGKEFKSMTITYDRKM